MATHEKFLHSDLEWYTGQSLTPTKTTEEDVQVNFFIPGTQFFFLNQNIVKRLLLSENQVLNSCSNPCLTDGKNTEVINTATKT